MLSYWTCTDALNYPERTSIFDWNIKFYLFSCSTWSGLSSEACWSHNGCPSPSLSHTDYWSLSSRFISMASIFKRFKQPYIFSGPTVAGFTASQTLHRRRGLKRLWRTFWETLVLRRMTCQLAIIEHCIFGALSDYYLAPCVGMSKEQSTRLSVYW